VTQDVGIMIGTRKALLTKTTSF